MYIYLDVLFAVNVIMDFLLLKLTAAFAAVSLKNRRALLASMAGGVGGVCFFIPDFHALTAAGAGIFLGFLTVYLAFFPIRTKEFLKRVLLFFCASFVMGGLEFFSMMAFGQGMIKNGVAYIQIPQLFCCAGAGFFLIKITQLLIKKRAAKTVCQVSLYWKKQKVTIEGLQDTGNNLTEPQTHQPVILVEGWVLKRLIHPDCNAVNLSEWIPDERLREIPYRSIDAEGTLVGIVLDAVCIDGRKIPGAVVAVCEQRLQYSAILSAGI